MTDREWEERYQTFASVLEKLDDADLQKLTFIFECHPTYVGEREKHHYIENLWYKFRDLRHGASAAESLREALTVLRLR